MKTLDHLFRNYPAWARHKRMIIKTAVTIGCASIALILKGNRITLTLLAAQFADMLAYGLVGDAAMTQPNKP